jgi:glycerol uptake facilitator-like aquaporin
VHARLSAARRLVAEYVGTALLVAMVVGSGIAADRLGDSDGLALLVDAFATGAGLVALILALGPVSGAHFNPAVTVTDALLGGLSWRLAGGYVAVQAAGGGVLLHLVDVVREPGVTLARTLSDTFTGIRPADAVASVPAQLAGAVAATALMRWLYPSLADAADDVVVPAGGDTTAS